MVEGRALCVRTPNSNLLGLATTSGHKRCDHTLTIVPLEPLIFGRLQRKAGGRFEHFNYTVVQLVAGIHPVEARLDFAVL